MALPCVNDACSTVIYESSKYYVDDRLNNAFCCRSCYEDWAAENAEALTDYYASMNLYEEGV